MLEPGVGEVSIEQGLEQFLLILCVSLGVATLPQIFGWFRKIPYTLMLVIVGTGLAFLDIRLISLSPNLILFIFLPPLLFEAAWNSNWSNLKQQLVPVSLFASLGVVASIAGVAFGLTQFAGLSAGTALLIGACLSATDPVSVLPLFKELGVGKTLFTVMEGESLFNDGTAIVAFSFLLDFAVGMSNLPLQPILRELFAVVGIGLGVGIAIGLAVSYLTQRFELPLVEQSLTLVSAYGAYLLSEELGGSGVIAMVVAGLILGNFGSRVGMDPRTSAIVVEFWEFVAFFVNSIVFLLIGNQIRFDRLAENGWRALLPVAVTIVGMVLARLLYIYVLSFFSNRISPSQISLPEQTVLWWGGLRGAVAIALALSVPSVYPDRSVIISGVLGAVLFTLLVQGLTIQPLVARLNLSSVSDQSIKQEYREAIARQSALNRALQHLKQAKKRPGIDPEFYAQQVSLVQTELTGIKQKIDQMGTQFPDTKEFAQEQLCAELKAIETETYAELMQNGQLNQALAPVLGGTNQAEA